MYLQVTSLHHNHDTSALALIPRTSKEENDNDLLFGSIKAEFI
jgi:hypothetical protein